MEALNKDKVNSYITGTAIKPRHLTANSSYKHSASYSNHPHSTVLAPPTHTSPFQFMYQNNQLSFPPYCFNHPHPHASHSFPQAFRPSPHNPHNDIYLFQVNLAPSSCQIYLRLLQYGYLVPVYSFLYDSLRQSMTVQEWSLQYL
ncbi:hypothetical protein BU24DRAFT_423233 [Aaosphaeria arxii CBS 175.79]|uniref:Uncharacterized protein n=1 Tax=Aaosphaeria arxii CBS 175.79 TaxID=1450172 RepID=A0A6A5XN89_9PLEO|nr:uncharacterized protein BU24DRAFT_423233 [Aaosphaeria arxii CBS 175.79]KAF2014210.1 hypothetical protein BU24DRAFT_423233 [Aaosphaeria arxii CBS 175.79]